MAFKVLNREIFTPETQPTTGGGKTLVRVEIDPTTKKTKAIQYTRNPDGTVTNEITIYEDGVFNGNGVITTDQERLKLHTEIQNALKKPNVIKELNGTPTFVNSSYSVLGQNASPNAPTLGVENILDTLFNNLLGLRGIELLRDQIGNFFEIEIEDKMFNSRNMEELYPSSKTFLYPIDLSPAQDRLYITQYIYSSPYTDAFKTPTQNLAENGIRRGSALKKQLASVILPMPNKVDDQNSVNWGSGDSLKSLDIAAAGDTGGMLGIAAGKLAAEALQENIKKTGNPLTDVLSNPKMRNAVFDAARDVYLLGGLGGLNTPVVKAALQAAILKAAGVDVPAETILSRGYGVVANSNLELLFNGPTLRNFSFTYRMSPRDKPEAETIRKIIRYFKQGMAVKKANSSNGAGGSSFLLSTPNVFKLRYVYGNANTPISGVNKFKICALTNFSATYAPDGQWAAYDEGQPASVVISLRFSELEPVYESDYQSTIFDGPGSNFKDNYEQVNNDDIGY